MCGRYTLTRSGRELRQAFELESAPEVGPRYNIAPTQESLVVRRAREGGRRAELAVWGFGAGGGGRLMINARSETVADKPSFRDSFARRRCLVPADGFYEWRRERGRARPFHFATAAGGLMAFGGLWKPTLDLAGEAGLVFTILTVPANELVAPVHPRMPLVLAPADWPRWLNPGAARSELDALLRPAPAAALTVRAVSTTVNDVACDSPACLAPPEPLAAVQLDLLT